MDILAHGLWAGAAAKIANKKRKKKSFPVLRTALFGVFPDLFAFTVLMMWYGIKLLGGEYHFSDLPQPSEVEPSSPDTIWIFRFTTLLYSISHSFVVFLLVFALIFLIKRRILLEMFGWLFHIVIDVFTHSYAFYPTPVFWPISTWHFDGLPWDTPWFMVANYASLFLIYIFLTKKGRIERFRKRIASIFENETDLRFELKRIVGRSR